MRGRCKNSDLDTGSNFTRQPTRHSGNHLPCCEFMQFANDGQSYKIFGRTFRIGSTHDKNS